MLVFSDRKFIKSPFENEAELENVIITNYEYLFGPDSFFLPKAKIKTADGIGTIPDGFAIDLASKRWYVVEAELSHHDVWNHISKQVSKQILASQQPLSKRIIEDLSVELYNQDNYVKEKFESLGILTVDVRKIIQLILDTEPIIGLPIDGVPNDLREWAKMQRYKVKLWTISKFVEFNNQTNIVYEFPEEFRPTFDTEEENQEQGIREIAKYDVEIIDLINSDILNAGDKLYMTYRPRNGVQKKYEATTLEDGSLAVLNNIYSSPSYAALSCIQDSGSVRQTVNGWTAWKTIDGRTLADLREIYLQTKN